MKVLMNEEITEIMVGILKNISDFCEKRNIQYYLGFGTMLGAVRHQGMIPWDYDIDIVMPRNDYKKFIKLFNQENTNNKLKIMSRYLNKSYKGKICRVYNTQTYNVTDKNLTPYDIDSSICVEIYPIDGMTDDIRKQKDFQLKMRMFILLYEIKNVKFSTRRKLYKNAILFFLKFITAPINVDFILDKIDTLSQTYSIDDNELITVGPVSIRLLDKVSISKKVIDSKTIMNYEGLQMPVPKGYDMWLKALYGNYMQFPKKEEIDKSIRQRNYYKFALKED